jgi:hypothetical protein
VPNNATVRVTNLDGTDQAYSTTAFSDGHFSIALPAQFGDELRFEWRLGEQRSAPVDALYLQDSSGFRLQRSARFDCVELTPGFVLDFGAAQTDTLSLEVANHCASALSIDSQSTRRGLTDFSATTAVPLSIAVGGSGTLVVTYNRTSTAAVEDTLFFQLTQAGTTIRYPVTLSADP